jgi:hypothetical protein
MLASLFPFVGVISDISWGQQLDLEEIKLEKSVRCGGGLIIVACLRLIKDPVGSAVEISSDQSVWGSVLCEVDQSDIALVKCRRQHI